MVIKLQDEQRKATTTVVANGVIEAMAVGGCGGGGIR